MNVAKVLVGLLCILIGIGGHVFFLKYNATWHPVGKVVKVETIDPNAFCNPRYEFCIGRPYTQTVTYVLWTQDGNPNQTYSQPLCDGPECAPPGHYVALPGLVISYMMLAFGLFEMFLGFL